MFHYTRLRLAWLQIRGAAMRWAALAFPSRRREKRLHGIPCARAVHPFGESSR